MAAAEALMFFLPFSFSSVIFFSLSSARLHPVVHPEAACLSLFLLKLSSEVSGGLAFLIPDTVNEKRGCYTGRLTGGEETRQSLPRSVLPCETL